MCAFTAETVTVGAGSLLISSMNELNKSEEIILDV